MTKPILFLDGNNMLIRTLFAQKELIANPDPDFALHKHLFLATLFSNIRKFEPSEVVIAIDDKKNWRKSVYPEYKANRKEMRDKDVFPWEKYYVYVDEFIEDIKKCFPFKILKVDYAEADDIIAVLTRHVPNDSIVVTSDSDYIQLLADKRIRIWDPFKQKFIEDANPNQTMLIKILAGDSGDNIPNVKPKLGPKTAEKLIVSGELDKYLTENNLTENYERNIKLINWNHIPDVLKKRILETYYNVWTTKPTPDLFSFFVRNHLRKLSEDVQEISFMLKPFWPAKEGEFFEAS
jgi:5'-3' exonuclease